MSHEIRYATYPENVNRKGVKRDWDIVVQHENYQEGASELPSDIRWIEDIILNSEEEAKEYIDTHDKGWYDQLAVRFKEIKIKKSKKQTELENKISELTKEFNKRNSIPYATTVKSEYIGCKSCGSKLASKYIQNTNKCPLCHNDLRSLTTLSSLGKLTAKISDNKKILKEEEKKLAKQQEKNAVIKWLVKVEFHT